MDGDALLSTCWTQAVKFARNYRANAVDLDHLLLAAARTDGAEAVLLTACSDVGVLSKELSSRCGQRARESEAPDDQVYGPAHGLSILLYEAAALATRAGTPYSTSQ